MWEVGGRRGAHAYMAMLVCTSVVHAFLWRLCKCGVTVFVFFICHFLSPFPPLSLCVNIVAILLWIISSQMTATFSDTIIEFKKILLVHGSCMKNSFQYREAGVK